MKGKIYLVATPIGNLEDITIRAINILKKVDIIAAEDTRHTLGLLNHFNISKPLISYYKEVELKKSNFLIEKLLDGMNIAVVSDAGTPAISDPGEEIVKKAIENDIEIIPIPGACAFINALISSGLSTREFIYLGFLPFQKKLKKEKLEEIKYDKKTIILYEAPHKLLDTLKCIYDILGDRKIVLARELTKIHEEFIRGSVSHIINKLTDIKGEYVVIIEGNNVSKSENEIINLNKCSLEDHYLFYKEKGLTKKDIIKKIAKDRCVSHNEIYQYFLKY